MHSFPQHSILLDIETSGLRRQTDCIISLGIIYKDSNQKISFKHWFLESKEEEKCLLESFLLFLKDSQTIYSYGGKSFDYPFLRSRLEYHGIDLTPFLKLKLIDMKEAFKHFTKQRTHFETFFNIKRQSTLTGRDIVKLYHTYETSSETLYRELILKHQIDELNSLLAFLELYRLFIHFNHLKCVDCHKNSYHLTFQLTSSDSFAYSFTSKLLDWQISYEKGSPLLELTVPLLNTSLKHYLEPVKDYVYVASQKQLMHKSLAQFIPSTMKRRATKEECSVSKTTTYLALFTTYKVALPLWYDENKGPYIESKDITPDLLGHQLFSLLFNPSISSSFE